MSVKKNYFLIECDQDNSLLITNKKHVICDSSVKIEDEVNFLHNQKNYIGKVLGMSSKYNNINMCAFFIFFFFF